MGKEPLRARLVRKPAFLVLIVVLMVLTGPAIKGRANFSPLALRDRGEAVRQVQNALTMLGFYQGRVDGIYGQETELGVRIFQHNYGLNVDGIVGQKTWDALVKYINTIGEHVYRLQPGETLWTVANRMDISSRELVRINRIKDPNHLPVGFAVKLPEEPPYKPATANGIQIVPWDRVNKEFKLKMTVQVTDVETGLSFKVQRMGGSLHADVEPVTRKDTQTFKKIYGGTWSWERRAIVVTLNGKKIAASMNGFPHGFEHLTNGFPGHFCIHFYGSRIHKSRLKDEDHQRMVLAAAGLDYY